ncbi:MAG TPA: S41 family peptidase [Thermoanaerobaculia bacterium]|jgi:C-terminal processing protease CtpA/Prc|nr:S41 family peptidase [Thermoanaerobaculia bacterium]
MRLRPLLLLLLLAFPAAADETGRLCELIRLWSAVRYHHPYLYDRDVDWDGAFVAAVPRVRAAAGDAERIEALRRMLGALGDPATVISRREAGEGFPSILPGDSSPSAGLGMTPLYLDLRPYQGLEGAMRFADREDELAKAENIIVDLRTGNPEAEFFMLEELPVTRESSRPAERQVMHSGYRPQDDGSSRGYYTAFFTVPPKVWLASADAKTKRVVFVIDSVTPVPPFVRALQESGAAQIVAEGPLNRAPSRMEVPLAGGYKAWIRTAQALEGWEGGADAVVGPGKGMAKAKELLRGPAPAPHERRAARLGDLQWRADERYPEMAYPPVEYRLLAAARMWGIVHYFYPYLDLIGDWDAVLPRAVDEMLRARDQDEYTAAAIGIMRNVEDTHTGVSGTPAVARVTGGRSPMPIEVRQVEHRWIVTRLLDEQAAYGFTVGDELISIDGEPAAARATRLSRWLTASTPAGLRYLLSLRMTGGEEGSTGLAVVEKADGTRRGLRAVRKRSWYGNAPKSEPWRLINGDLGYVDLRVLTVARIDAMLEAMRGTKSIIFDMRGYPNAVAYPMIGRFNTRGAKVGAIFRRKLVQAPIGNETDFTIEFRQELPQSSKPKYAGTTFMLVDERTISQAEHTGLWLQAASGTRFVGSQTAGADGDVTWFYLPGALRVNMTGHDVRHADGRQLQRVGLVPEVKVAPTVAGIRAGRDEELEAAVALATATLRDAHSYQTKP